MQEVQIYGRVVRINGFNDKFIVFGRDGSDYQLYILYVNWDSKKVSLTWVTSDNYGGYNDFTLCENSGSTFITLGKRLFSCTNGTSVSKWNISSPVIISYSNNYMYYAGKIYSIPISPNWSTIYNNKTEIGSINCTNNQVTFDKDNKHIYSVDNNNLYIYKIEGNTVVQQDVISFDNISIKYMLNTPFCVTSNKISTHYIYLSSENIITSIERDGYRYVSINVENIPKSSEVLEGKSYIGMDGITKLGTMPNNGELNYIPSSERQVIPKGYTSGGTIEIAEISNTDEYDYCLNLSTSIINHTKLSYIQLSYLQTSGTQWINTGLTATNDIELEIRFKTIQSTSSYGRIIGTTNDCNFEFCDMKSMTNYRFSINSSKAATNIILNNNDFNTIKMTGNGKLYINDKLTIDLNSSPNNSALQLFTTQSGKENGRLQVSYCKIWKNSELVRNFIPVKDKDSIVCLYDKVNEKFYKNNGTGDFIGGDEL